MSFIRQRRVGGQVYFEEVESVRVNGKVRQRYIRYVGKTPDAPPRKFKLEAQNSSYIALKLATGKLTPNEVFEILEQQGERFSKESLERIGLFYAFGEKTTSLSLYYARKSRRRGGAPSAAGASAPTRRGRAASARSKGPAP